jgi:hypothetical protein
MPQPRKFRLIGHDSISDNVIEAPPAPSAAPTLGDGRRRTVSHQPAITGGFIGPFNQRLKRHPNAKFTLPFEAVCVT